MASAVAVSPVEASATNILSQKLLTEKDKMTNIEIDKRIIHIFFQELLGGKDKSGTNILPQKLLAFKKKWHFRIILITLMLALHILVPCVRHCKLISLYKHCPPSFCKKLEFAIFNLIH